MIEISKIPLSSLLPWGEAERREPSKSPFDWLSVCGSEAPPVFCIRKAVAAHFFFDVGVFAASFSFRLMPEWKSGLL